MDNTEFKDFVEKNKVVYETIQKKITRHDNIERANRECVMRLFDEIGEDVTPYVKYFLILVANCVPVGTGLLKKCHETATEKELGVLKKHGITM